MNKKRQKKSKTSAPEHPSKISGFRVVMSFLFVLILLFLGSKHLYERMMSAGTGSPHDVLLLESQAFSLGPSNPSTRGIWLKVLQIHPKNSNARLQLGLEGMFSSERSQVENSFRMLEELFDPKMVDKIIPMPTLQAILIASIIGRWRWERYEYEKGRYFLENAQEQTFQTKGKSDECLALQLASMTNRYPTSLEAKQNSIASYTMQMEKLLVRKSLELNEEKLREEVPGAASDPYVHCLFQAFSFELYNAENISYLSSLHFKVTKKVWPDLVQVLPNPRNCRASNKIKLGIISGFLRGYTPVALDFDGVLRRLNRDKFEITFIIGTEHNTDESFRAYHPNDKQIILEKRDQDNYGSWPKRYHKTIWNLKLDIALFLECTLSTHTHRLAMTRFAPVQAVTYGHPITSGIPRDIMDYYISWGAAETPDAQNYYMEELLLLDSHSIHQYYEEALNKDSFDSNGFISLQQQGRKVFDIPTEGHWYLSMQKPYKFQPEFDSILCGILNSDPEGRLILQEPLYSNYNILVNRLAKAKCDMFRVHFLPFQIPHFLFSLYYMSDVILDTYPFGGCISTRGALELGKAVVTLPSLQLGGRWTSAYYKIMGDETLNKHVIATSTSDYIHKAVQIGSNEKLRHNLQRRIRKVFPKLLYKMEAVHNWENMLTKIAPKSCQKGKLQDASNIEL